VDDTANDAVGVGRHKHRRLTPNGTYFVQRESGTA
jgi:hypothetical protein